MSERPEIATYESIEPLVARAEQDGDVLRVTFQCPRSGANVRAAGHLVRGRGLEDLPRGETSLLKGMRQLLSALFTQAFSAETAEAAEQLAATEGREDAAREPGEGAALEYTESERRAATVLAFRAVADRWAWAAASGAHPAGWIAIDEHERSPFAHQLEVAPLLHDRDRLLLARMLVEVARADGRVTPEEWRSLTDLVPCQVASVDTIMEQPPLEPNELDEASRGAVRDTLLMLAWALALSDEDLDAAERERLSAFARGLRIPPDRSVELERHAKRYLIEQALDLAYAGGKPRKRAR